MLQRSSTLRRCPSFQSKPLAAKQQLSAPPRLAFARIFPSTQMQRHSQCVFSEAAAATAPDSEAVLQRIKQQFEERAAAYDQDNTFHPMLAQHLLPLGQLQPGQHVLDLATGTGLVAFQAAAAVGPTGSVTAVDISPGMLEQAKRKYQSSLQQPQQSLAPITFTLGDIEQLDSCLESSYKGSYDVITCSAAVPFLRDYLATFKDWKLWLKSSGRTVFNTFESPPDFQTFVRLAKEFGLSDERDPSELLGSEQRIRDFLSLAGFHDIQVSIAATERWQPAETPEAHAESTWRTAFARNPFMDSDRLQRLGDKQQAFHDAFVEAVVRDVTSSGRHDSAGKRVLSGHNFFSVSARE